MAQQTRHGNYGGARQLYGSFAGKALAIGIQGPCWVQGQVYNPGFQEGQEYLPEFKKGQVYNPEFQEGQGVC